MSNLEFLKKWVTEQEADPIRTYISSESEAPKGVKVKRGSKGGLYYVPTDKEGTKDEEKKNEGGKEEQEQFQGEISVESAEEELKQLSDRVKTNSMQLFSNLPSKHWNGVRIILTSTPSKIGDLAEYNEMTDSIFLTKASGNITSEQIAEYYSSEFPGISSPWRIMMLHEVGHRVASNFMSEWKQLNHDKPAITKYGDTDLDERFAESYLYYIQDPLSLLIQDEETYQFMKSKVFNGTEYEAPLIKANNKNNERPSGSHWIDMNKTSIANLMTDDLLMKSFGVGIGGNVGIFTPTFGGSDILTNKKKRRK